jgi:hypothetical protein
MVHPPPTLMEPLNQSQEESKDEEDDDDHTCIVCMDNPRSHLILPCFHFILCGECVLSYQVGRDCPVCSGRIIEIKKVFKT